MSNERVSAGLQRVLAGLMTACAQDPFEIHVYDYETLKPVEFTLEQHHV